MWSINGINYNLTSQQRNQVLIDSCTQLGFDVPRFCYHENLRIAGNCRMCLIEDSKSPKPVICCASNASQDLSIFTNTLQVKKSRESVMEFLLINHPLDCPICDQGGECDLQDLALVYGSDHGRFYDYKRNVEDKNCGPIVKTVMNRCILCTRCVRFATDVAGFNSFGLTGRGGKMEIGSYIETVLDSELSGNIVDVCPVGALTSKPYSFNSRPWELKVISLFNALDDQPQLIRADIKENEIVRLIPAKNANGKNLWLTNRARFSYEGLIRNRIIEPEIYGVKTSWLTLITTIKKFFDCFLTKFTFYQQFLINFDLQDLNSLTHFDLISMREFLTALGLNGGVSVSDNILEKSFTFLPRVLELDLNRSTCFVLLSLNLIFELPITSLLLTQRLNELSGLGLLVTWRSAVTPILTPFTTNLNITGDDIINFMSAKTWLNLVLPENLTCFYGVGYQQLIQMFSCVAPSFQKFLVTTSGTVRNIIDISLSSLVVDKLLSTSTISYTVGTDDNSLTVNSVIRQSFISFSYSTHFSLNLLTKFMTSFTLPNKTCFESSNYNYNLDYSHFKSFRTLSAPSNAKSLSNFLKVLAQLFRISTGSLNCMGDPMSKVLTPFLSVKFLSFYHLTYLLKNAFYKKKMLSRTEYYQQTSLLRASPTLSSIQLSSFNNHIY